MKKLLLLVLTVVMLVCVAIFGTNAANECPDDNHTLDSITVAPTCDKQGYDIVYCVECGKHISRNNYVKAEGHLWNDHYISATDSQGAYYKNERTCIRENCGKTEIETKVVDDKTVNVRYYLVQFFNAKVSGGYLTELTLDNGKTINVKHAKLADTAKFKTVPLCKSDIYVREHGEYTYDGELPRRGKDVDAGEYTFVGWTSDVKRDTDFEPDIPTVDPTNPSVNNYEIKLEDITSNHTYFACWKSVDVTYSVQFMNSNNESWISPNNGQMQIPHGGTVNYIWIYPTREPTVSSDFVFTGWGCGDTTKKDAQGNYTQYDRYMLEDNIHISEVPIFSNDAFVAIHDTVDRIYKVQFDFKNNTAPFVTDIPYGKRLDLKKDEVTGNYTLNLNGTHTVPGEYRDETYIYQFNNSFVTSGGHEIKSSSFSVPNNTLDADDVIYLEYALDTTEKTRFTIGNQDVVFDKADLNNNPDDDNAFFDYFATELEFYNFCMDIKNETVYEGINFDLSKNECFYLVSEHGDYIYDDAGNKICLEVSFKGIYKVDSNGAKVPFTREDAQKLRIVKVEPDYRSIVRLYPFTVEVVFPTVLNGKTLELIPEDYADKLIVQVKNENGHQLARGYTDSKSYSEVTDSKGNTYIHLTCSFAVQKAERYEISVASTDEKYEGKKTLYWSVYTTMYDSVNNKMKSNILVDTSIRDGYNQSVNCNCLCHGIFKGLWVRVLNILYSLFKVKYECCPHMHAELGDLLAY